MMMKTDTATIRAALEAYFAEQPTDAATKYFEGSAPAWLDELLTEREQLRADAERYRAIKAAADSIDRLNADATHLERRPFQGAILELRWGNPQRVHTWMGQTLEAALAGGASDPMGEMFKRLHADLEAGTVPFAGGASDA